MTNECLPVTPANIAQCVGHLRDGEAVILPTDTVYGIAADAANEAAVRRIYAAKGKETQAPLQLLFGRSGIEMERFALLTPRALALIESLGPGGWTVIVPAREGWTSAALAGGRTVGIRVPDALVVDQVVTALGGPVAASSANVHGGSSPRNCEEAVAQLGQHCACALDGGPTRAGLDSTVIDLSGEEPRILREGAIDRLTVARILGLATIPVLRSVRQ